MCNGCVTLPTAIDWQLQASTANLQVVNVTTPANYFHVLRRQLARPYRKPLVVMAPKSLLRHRATVSALSELGPRTSFAPVLLTLGGDAVSEDSGTPRAVRKVVFCSGRVYVDLLEKCRAAEASDVAIVRLEQISPFPYHAVQEHLERFSSAQLVWCQEEPMNAGAWAYVKPRLQLVAHATSSSERRELRYAGRNPSAAAATGLAEIHKAELTELLAEALR